MLSAFIFVLGFIGVDSPAAAAPGNQGVNQSAHLVAPDPSTQIAVYLRPAVNKGKAGYGVDGDAVTILEQVSDNQSITWNHIRFDNPPYAEGWVPAKFVDFQSAGQTQQSEGNRYLGNQPAQSNRQNSYQSYSQRNQN